jgi:nitroreductase
LVNLARLSPSSGNKQALRYAVVHDQADCDVICESLLWAYYFDDWAGPEPHERPTGYIVLLRETQIQADFCHDAGIGVQSIVLGATERGLGACIFASADQEKFKKILNLPDTMRVELVVAIGRPTEIVVLDEILPGGDHRYWRDETGVHHVPKRRLQDVLWDYEQSESTHSN